MFVNGATYIGIQSCMKTTLCHFWCDCHLTVQINFGFDPTIEPLLDPSQTDKRKDSMLAEFQPYIQLSSLSLSLRYFKI